VAEWVEWAEWTTKSKPSFKSSTESRVVRDPALLFLRRLGIRAQGVVAAQSA